MDATTEKQILDRYRSTGPIGKRDVLERIPENERRWKCHTCFTIIDKSPCPVCGETFLQIMCPLDHCDCKHEVMTTVAYCDLCGEPICPECGDHSVVQVSRVTGYLSDVSGWGEGKRAEFRDRTRYNPVGTIS